MGPNNGSTNMSSQFESHVFKFLKLNGQNYSLWANVNTHILICIFPHIASEALGKGVHSQLVNMHWKVDEYLKYLINFPKRKYSLEI